MFWINSSCSTSCICHVSLVTNLMISHAWGNDQIGGIYTGLLIIIQHIYIKNPLLINYTSKCTNNTVSTQYITINWNKQDVALDKIMWVTNCCFTPSEQLFRCIIARTSHSLTIWWLYLFVLDNHASVKFFSCIVHPSIHFIWNRNASWHAP